MTEDKVAIIKAIRNVTSDYSPYPPSRSVETKQMTATQCMLLILNDWYHNLPSHEMWFLFKRTSTHIYLEYLQVGGGRIESHRISDDIQWSDRTQQFSICEITTKHETWPTYTTD